MCTRSLGSTQRLRSGLHWSAGVAAIALLSAPSWAQSAPASSASQTETEVQSATENGADAAQSPAADNAEIIVTATKRGEIIQDIALSVAALSAETLERSGTTSFEGYATQVPNLSFGFSGSGRQVARNFQLRGITGSGTSALYIGETPVSTSVDPRVVDLDRIEVLRGPQGTLFGARSMGGLVRLIPARPDPQQFTAKAHAGYGRVEEGGSDYAFDATVNVPLSGIAAVRITGYYLRESGFIDRLVDPDASMLARPLATTVTFSSGDELLSKDINRTDTYGMQAAVRLDATDRLTLTPRLMYQKSKSGGPNFVDNDINNFTKVRQFDVEEKGRDEWWLGTLEAEYELGIGSIVSSTSYFDRETLDSEDATPFIATRLGGRIRTAVDAPSITSLINKEKRFVQETRFVSDFEGPLQLIAGIFYQRLDTEGNYPPASIIPTRSPLIGIFGTTIAAGDSFFSLFQKTKSKELGFFGEASFQLTPDLKLTAGGRFYNVKSRTSRLDGGVLYTKLFGITPTQFLGTTNESGFNPRVALTYEPSRDLTFYLNAAKGFRPGAPNLGKAVCQANGFKDVPDIVRSDSLWNYEGGVKAVTAGGRVSSNFSVFHIKWKDRRTTVVADCGLGFGYADNIGAAISRGFEWEMRVKPGERTDLEGGLGYVDSRISDNGGLAQVKEGQRLADVPHFNAVAAINLEKEFNGITGYGRADYRYVGSSTSAQRNPRPEYSLVNLRAGARFANYDVSLFVNNLFDKRANLSDPTELSDALNLIAVNRPRTIGVDLRGKF